MQVAGSSTNPIDLEEIESPFTKEILRLPYPQNSTCCNSIGMMGAGTQLKTWRVTARGWNYMEQQTQLCAKDFHSHSVESLDSGLGFSNQVQSLLLFN